MAHKSIVTLTSDNFSAEAEGASVPIVIDFYTDWCGPCKMLAPVLDEVAAEVGDTAKVMKVDAGTQQELAKQFGVTAVPTLVFMKGGEEKERNNGVMMKDDIISKLQGLA